MNNRFLAVSFSIVFVAIVLIIGGFQSSSSPTQSMREEALSFFRVEQNVEAEAYEKAELLSDEKLKDRVRQIYDAWLIEEQWASFIQVLLLHQKQHDIATYNDWNQSWFDFTGAFWVQTNMFGYRARDVFAQSVYDRTAYLDLYASLSVRLEIMRAARVKLVRGLMQDVLDPGDVVLFMEPWPAIED